MSPTIPLLNEDEVRRSVPVDEEAGFGALATPRGRLPLKALDVYARIDGLLVEVTVSQTFVNVLGEPLEATYVFPLPDRAAVTQFRMEVGGRIVEGVLKERGQARQEYDQAIQQGHRAAITEEERPGVFTMRVGNLMPGEAATVRLTLTGPLTYSDGEATFRFPLVVAPRYIPGVPLSGPGVGTGTASDTDAVPDASRITPPVLLPGFPNPVWLALTVDVYPSDLPVSAFRSTLHAILQAVADGGVRRILLQPGERLDRDFILRFRVGDGAVRTALTLTPDSADAREGTFALSLVPPVEPARAPRPRDVIFVLDRSGSMSGWKMVAARRALGRMVDTLTERDRFAVHAFDDRIEKPAAFADLGLQAGTDRNRCRAAEFLAGVEARGGTEMAQPLSMAAHLLAGDRQTAAVAARERILVLITDGQVGNEDQIVRALANDLKRVRVFALGIDQAVNAAFLRRLADLGGGACELVESEDRLDEMLEHVHRRIGTPVLTGLRLEASGLQLVADTLMPSRLPDLFAGAPLSIFGRYRGAAEGSIRLSAAAPTGGWSQSVAGRVVAGGAVPSLWARGHLRELEDQFVTGRGDTAALERRIVETSLRYGVLCRFTSFLAVDRTEAPNRGGKPERVIQPVEAPAGWDMVPAPGALPAFDRVLHIPVTDFELAARGSNARKEAALETLGELAAPELQRLRNAIERVVPPGHDMVTMGKLPQTPRAKKVIEFAIEEADYLAHAEVEPEHLLLGLLREAEGVAAHVLTAYDLKLDALREQVRAEFSGHSKVAVARWVKKPEGLGRFSERARKVMQFANQEAQRLNHEYIGTEHILLGLLRLGTGLVGKLLNALVGVNAGVTPSPSERETTSNHPSPTGA